MNKAAKYIVVFKGLKNSEGSDRDFYKAKYGDITPHIIDAERFVNMKWAKFTARKTMRECNMAKSLFSGWQIKTYD